MKMTSSAKDVYIFGNQMYLLSFNWNENYLEPQRDSHFSFRLRFISFRIIFILKAIAIY